MKSEKSSYYKYIVKSFHYKKCKSLQEPFLLLLFIDETKHTYKQAQCQAATETAALIHVFCCKVQFLFHLEMTFGEQVDVR